MKTAKERYSDYLNTDYWKAVEREVKSRAGWRCQICNSQHDLQAHHRTYEHRGHELEHLDDLTCLCRRCHAVFHGKAVSQPRVVAPAVRPRTNIKPHSQSEVYADMPCQETGVVTLTKELIDRCRTNGVFTNATIAAFGLCGSDVTKGWPSRLIGKRIGLPHYQQALEGRYVYATQRFEG